MCFWTFSHMQFMEKENLKCIMTKTSIDVWRFTQTYIHFNNYMHIHVVIAKLQNEHANLSILIFFFLLGTKIYRRFQIWNPLIFWCISWISVGGTLIVLPTTRWTTGTDFTWQTILIMCKHHMDYTQNLCIWNARVYQKPDNLQIHIHHGFY